MKTIVAKSLQTVAAEWYTGQASALYAYASTGTVKTGLAREIAVCLPGAKPREQADLMRLHVATAPPIEIENIMACTEFWHRLLRNADGSPLRCRKTGKIKLWKTRPGQFRQPVKYGLRESFYLTPDNIGDWCEPL